MTSQTNRILAWLRTGRNLTALGALHLFRCARLAARICELRERGYEIKTTMTRKRGKCFASYWL